MSEKLKNDSFRKARGGYSRWLRISCEKCGTNTCLYQKDGPGPLKRMYVDRIKDSKVLLTKKDLLCPKQHVLGVKIVYEKENRPAFRIFAEAVIKRLTRV
jgi:hypothetical protein